MADGGGRVGGHGPGMVPVHPAQNEHHRPAGWRHDEAMRPPQLPQRAISCHQPRGRHQPIIRFPANCRAATFSSSLEKAGRPGETPCLSPPARNDRQSLRRRLCRGRCVVACRRPRLPVGLPGLPAANHLWLVMSISHPGLQRQIIFHIQVPVDMPPRGPWFHGLFESTASVISSPYPVHACKRRRPCPSSDAPARQVLEVQEAWRLAWNRREQAGNANLPASNQHGSEARRVAPGEPSAVAPNVSSLFSHVPNFGYPQKNAALVY